MVYKLSQDAIKPVIARRRIGCPAMLFTDINVVKYTYFCQNLLSFDVPELELQLTDHIYKPRFFYALRLKITWQNFVICSEGCFFYCLHVFHVTRNEESEDLGNEVEKPKEIAHSLVHLFLSSSVCRSAQSFCCCYVLAVRSSTVITITEYWWFNSTGQRCRLRSNTIFLFWRYWVWIWARI